MATRQRHRGTKEPPRDYPHEKLTFGQDRMCPKCKGKQTVRGKVICPLCYGRGLIRENPHAVDSSDQPT